MEQYEQFLAEANKSFRRADHMLYITYPIVKEKRLLIKILEEIYLSMKGIVNGILHYDYAFKRIQIYKESSMNMELFKNVCAARYSITPEQVNLILEIFNLMKEHKDSPLEFMRRDKVVIMTNNMHVESISVDKLKEYLYAVKDIYQKASSKIIRNN
ncbi:hypothetical protein COS75_00075 [Candidatus Pacearchaeota archaeon CG06_land_8_20_14_3_00_35_12]|nr:MAG: hypothetical protein COS75_00075 [Candidatus Pacearchaeota archaeon CG06_land_8_20_14_3_00_35_12]